MELGIQTVPVRETECVWLSIGLQLLLYRPQLFILSPKQSFDLISSLTSNVDCGT